MHTTLFFHHDETGPLKREHAGRIAFSYEHVFQGFLHDTISLGTGKLKNKT